MQQPIARLVHDLTNGTSASRKEFSFVRNNQGRTRFRQVSHHPRRDVTEPPQTRGRLDCAHAGKHAGDQEDCLAEALPSRQERNVVPCFVHPGGEQTAERWHTSASEPRKCLPPMAQAAAPCTGPSLPGALTRAPWEMAVVA